MGELIAAGGCWNANRFAVDGAGANLRTWRGAIETNQQFLDSETLILAASFCGDDMNAASGATFKVQWKNVSDAGSYADLAATGEIKWASSSDLTDDATLASAAYANSPDAVDCVGKGWTVEAGESVEAEGDNEKSLNAQDDELLEIHWAIDLSGADSANQDTYQFRIVDTSNSVIGEGTGILTVVIAGKIDGTTKDATRASAVGGVTVSAFLSDGAGSDPKPEGELVAQVVSHASTGVYSLTGLASGAGYFLHFYKDDTADLSDGSPVVTAVAA
jgi:hypothetical protein